MFKVGDIVGTESDNVRWLVVKEISGQLKFLCVYCDTQKECTLQLYDAPLHDTSFFTVVENVFDD